MPDDAEQDAPSAVRKPSWMPEAMLRAMQQATDRAFAWGRMAEGAAAAAREVASVHMPAAPTRMISGAVAAVVADPEGWTGRRDPASPAPATRAEVVEALCYALRFGEDGRRNSGGNDFIAPNGGRRARAAPEPGRVRRHPRAAPAARPQPVRGVQPRPPGRSALVNS